MSLYPSSPLRWQALLPALCLAAAPAAAQMTIDEIVITAGPARTGGSFTDYFIDPVVTGTGIDTVLLSSQNGVLTDVVMAEVTPGEFTCDEDIPSQPCENFGSLAAISGLGNLTFELSGDLGELDTVTVPLADYDPGAGQAGFPTIVSPTHLQANVSTTATVEWSTPPSWVDAVEATLEEYVTGLFTDEVFHFGAPPTATTWMPAGLTGGTSYDLDVSFYDIFFFEADRSSSGGRDFLFSSGFEAFNEHFFVVPEPSRVASLAVGAVLLLGLARRRRARAERGRTAR